MAQDCQWAAVRPRVQPCHQQLQAWALQSITAGLGVGTSQTGGRAQVPGIHTEVRTGIFSAQHVQFDAPCAPCIGRIGECLAQSLAVVQVCHCVTWRLPGCELNALHDALDPTTAALPAWTRSQALG